MSRDPDLCVITCAVTGVLANRTQCPAIPYTPVEIAEEAKRAYDAGASVLHIHARNDDGAPTFSPATFAKIKEEIQKRCPILLNFSTGTILEDVSDQCTYLRECRPHIGALNMGTMNYSKYSEKRKSFVFDMVFPNTYDKIMKLLSTMNESGVKPELECFDSGHTHGIWPLLDMGILKKPLQFSFIVNVLGGIPPTVESLQLQTKLMPPGSEWEVIGIPKCQWKMMATALVLGGNIRAGLEDNLYLPSGEMAKSNGELIEVAARMVRDTGRKVATVEQAREILSIDQFAKGIMMRTIRVTMEGPVMRITLNVPERRNAISVEMVNELLHTLEPAMVDPNVRVVVLTGAGDAFCVGADLARFAGEGGDMLPQKGDYADLLRLMMRFEKPIIARVNGHAMGGGLGLAAAATFAIASRKAKLGTPEVNMGLFPMMIMAVLARLMPRRRLLEMLIFGERYDGDEAARLGIINVAVAPEDLDATVQTYVDRIVAKSPLTLSLGLRAFGEQDDASLEEALPKLRAWLFECLKTEDAREGIAAFMEKRPPVWTGK